MIGSRDARSGKKLMVNKISCLKEVRLGHNAARG
jgi:hypothetical protein